MDNEEKYNKFNDGNFHRPSEYHEEESYKNLHRMAIDAKEFLNYGIQSQRKHKKSKKEAINTIIYFSKTVNKFCTGNLSDKQHNYLLENTSKQILKDINSGKAIGLEQTVEEF